ncbi:MAG: Mur ligase family protein [Planctomycetota bacterium]
MAILKHTRPVGIRLAEALTTVVPPTAEFFAKSCTADAGRVKPGDAYFAPPGDAVAIMPDIERAIARGAGAVVTDQWLPIAGAPQFVVEDPRAAFGQLCHALVGDPCESLATTAIAGCRGKTSTAQLLASILKAAGHPTATAEAALKSSAASTASWLAHRVADGVTHAVLESPAAAACDSRLAGTEFDVVCLTNLSNPTLRPSESVDSKRQQMTAAVDQLRPGGALVINADDPSSCRLLAEWPGAAVTYGINQQADLTATVIERHTGGQTFVLRCGNDSLAVATPTLGHAHLQNCLAAAATAFALGVSLEAIARGIESCPTVPARMQSVVCGQGFPIIVDAAADAGEASLALDAVAAVTAGRVLTVIDAPPGGRRQLTPAGYQQLAKAAQLASDKVISVAGSYAAPLVPDIRVVEDRFTAIALTLALAEDGDTVLILGGGCEPEALDNDEQTIRQLIELRLANSEPVGLAS